MIIVSQNKAEIVNFNNIGKIYIDYSNGNYKVICTDIQGCFLTSLAEYKTEERAKEVLQEIIDNYKFNHWEAVGQKNSVFKMPGE